MTSLQQRHAAILVAFFLLLGAAESLLYSATQAFAMCSEGEGECEESILLDESGAESAGEEVDMDIPLDGEETDLEVGVDVDVDEDVSLDAAETSGEENTQPDQISTGGFEEGSDVTLEDVIDLAEDLAEENDIDIGGGDSSSDEEPALPVCKGLDATVYVQDGVIFGGPDDGNTYGGTLNGTAGDDVIVGTGENDRIVSEGGNDTVCGGGGDDHLEGDAGNDFLCGEQGDDTVEGGSGNDTLCGDEGNDNLEGNGGDDAMDGGNGSDSLDGGFGFNMCANGESNDDCDDESTQVLACSEDVGGSDEGGESGGGSSGGSEGGDSGGGAGGDIGGEAGGSAGGEAGGSEGGTDGGETGGTDGGSTEGDDGGDIPPAIPLCKGEQATIYVLEGVIVGGPDDGNVFNGTLRGTDGNDTIVGTSDADQIDGNGGNDIICGRSGNDEIEGDSGDDMMCGEEGNDAIEGGSGNDTLCGGADDDNLKGNGGNDQIDGGEGFDEIDGNLGSDMCLNGELDDSCEGTATPILLCQEDAGGGDDGGGESEDGSDGGSDGGDTSGSTGGSDGGSEGGDTGGSDGGSAGGESGGDTGGSAGGDEGGGSDGGGDEGGGESGGDTGGGESESVAVTGISGGGGGGGSGGGGGHSSRTRPALSALDFLWAFYAGDGTKRRSPGLAIAPGAFGGSNFEGFTNPITPFDPLAKRSVPAGTPLNGLETRIVCSLTKIIDRSEGETATILSDRWIRSYIAARLGRETQDIALALNDPALCEGIPGSATVTDTQGEVAQQPAGPVLFILDEDGMPMLPGDDMFSEVWNNCVRNIVTPKSTGGIYNCSRYRAKNSDFGGRKWLHPLLNIDFGWNYRTKKLMISEEDYNREGGLVIMLKDGTVVLDKKEEAQQQ